MISKTQVFLNNSTDFDDPRSHPYKDFDIKILIDSEPIASIHIKPIAFLYTYQHIQTLGRR